MSKAGRFFILTLCLVMMCVGGIPVSAAEEKSNQTLLINGCETTDGWTADGEIALDTEDMTQGEGCISATLDAPKDGNSILSVRATFDDVNISGFAMITFDFYVSDPALLTSSRIIALDFGSAKTPDSELITWYETAFAGIDKAGWYRICLPVADAVSRGFKETSANYFGLQFFQVNPTEDLNDVVIKIDNISATVAEYKKLRTIDACDTADGWTGLGEHGFDAPPVADTANKKQGTASIQYQVNLPEEVHLVSQKQYEPMNAKGATHVEMDVFVSDLLAFRHSQYAIQFEITSSGTCDHQEYSWSLDEYVLQEGWNHIRLPISAAKTCDGAPNMTAVNYLRFHTLNIAQVKNNVWTFRVDNIYFSTPKAIENMALGATFIRGDKPENPPVNPPEDGEQKPPVTPLPGPGTENENNQDNESALRARQTQQKAKILLLVMIFAVIGIDAVVVALKRKKEQDAALAAAGDGQPPTEG